MVLVLLDEPEVPEEPLVKVGVEPDVEVEPEPPLVTEVGAGAFVTGTVTVAPVVVFTKVSDDGEPLPAQGMSATVEPPRDASSDGSVTYSMLPDRVGPLEGATG